MSGRETEAICRYGLDNRQDPGAVQAMTCGTCGWPPVAIRTVRIRIGTERWVSLVSGRANLGDSAERCIPITA
jgi:hypothetical protein